MRIFTTSGIILAKYEGWEMHVIEEAASRGRKWQLT